MSFPAENTPTHSPVPPDSGLFSPNSGSTASSPRGASAAHNHNTAQSDSSPEKVKHQMEEDSTLGKQADGGICNVSALVGIKYI